MRVGGNEVWNADKNVKKLIAGGELAPLEQFRYTATVHIHYFNPFGPIAPWYDIYLNTMLTSQ